MKALLLVMTMMSISISLNAHAGKIEDMAFSTARELSNNLPQKVNANMTSVKAFAAGKTVGLNALLHYDEKKMREIFKSAGLDYETTKSKFKVAQTNSICGVDAIRTFINMGGTVSYHFNFSDGNQYDVITVISCS